jgi:23S rRNA pseudouridine2605 synthase
VRINVFVASSTGMSRRAADETISSGRIAINNHPALLGQTVDDGAVVTLDGRPLSPPPALTLLMLNKPAGYVSSRTKQGKSPILFALLPPEYQTLRTVGRLDRESTGLILLTDDGPFIQRHTHPSFEKDKVYELTLDQPLSQADLAKLNAGVLLTDGISRVQVTRHKGKELTVSLSEGRNRQLRRTMGSLGYKVHRLHRIQMGPYALGELAPGQWIKLERGTS